MLKYKYVRKDALKYWKKETKRVRKPGDANDNFEKSFECTWQDLFLSNTVHGGPPMHNSIFCGMGDWSTHITDLLTDKRYDEFDFMDECESAALFRHYTRILLCTSEILTDLETLLNILNVKNARKFLSSKSINGKLDVVNLFDYINNTCKHKLGDIKHTNKLHNYNHHYALSFDDEKTKLSNDNFIRVPSLMSILEIIIHAYKKVDQHLKDNHVIKYVDVLKKYETELSKVWPLPVNDISNEIKIHDKGKREVSKKLDTELKKAEIKYSKDREKLTRATS